MKLDVKLPEKVYKFPLTLLLNKNGVPMEWVGYERAAYYKAKNKILWSSGEFEITLHGGTNAKTGLQSTLVLSSIIAVNTSSTASIKQNKTPSLTNKTLFERDNNMCAYCTGKVALKSLTRDHIIPTSKGGKDTWDNCVTACKTCNNWKGDRTLAEADMQLRYVPYTPSYNEHLILQNRKILTDQMAFLMTGVSKHSRLFREKQLETA